jgi:hypothetical protein
MWNEFVLLAGEVTSTTVTSQPIFGPVKAVFRVIGIAILFIAVVKAINHLAKGATLDAGKTLAYGLVAGFLCWDIAAPLAIIDGGGNLITKITDSIKGILTTVSA